VLQAWRPRLSDMLATLNYISNAYLFLDDRWIQGAWMEPVAAGGRTRYGAPPAAPAICRPCINTCESIAAME
jgi:hypothetical protein